MIFGEKYWKTKRVRYVRDCCLFLRLGYDHPFKYIFLDICLFERFLIDFKIFCVVGVGDGWLIICIFRLYRCDIWREVYNFEDGDSLKSFCVSGSV